MLRCYACRKPATHWYLRNRKWRDCCKYHHDKLLKKEFPLMYEGSALSTQESKYVKAGMLVGKVLVFVGFAAIMAYTFVGWACE